MTSERSRATNATSLALGVLVLVLFLSFTAPARAATGSSVSPAELLVGQVTIDKLQFENAVPSFARIGVNYTVKVVIDNTAGIVVPLVIQLSTPVTAIFAHPRIIEESVQPHSSAVANFTMVAFAPANTGPYQVTALVYVFFAATMTNPFLVDQATDTVSNTGPNPYPYLTIVIIGGLLIASALILVFHPGLLRRFIRPAVSPN